jgi:Bacterial Ig-like domain (group 3)
VFFRDGASALGTGVVNASGVATFSTSSLAVGAHSITAYYAGDGNFSASTSAAITQTVN